ncbi:skin secretory protein xP2-like [Penaeus vannamei]|uniref:skin secretory protein xP2-like n=1 Tax=Penaeus vannamei TaxID=6689 RepID=UPI00387F770F
MPPHRPRKAPDRPRRRACQPARQPAAAEGGSPPIVPERQGLPRGGGGHARARRLRLRPCPRPKRAQGAGEPKQYARGARPNQQDAPAPPAQGPRQALTPERQGLPRGDGGHGRARRLRLRPRPRPERAQGAGEPKPPARGARPNQQDAPATPAQGPRPAPTSSLPAGPPARSRRRWFPL